MMMAITPSENASSLPRFIASPPYPSVSFLEFLLAFPAGQG